MTRLMETTADAQIRAIRPDVRAYVGSIRNAEKRAYASHYAAWCLGLDVREMDYTAEQMYGCSYMAKQAVRLHLAGMGVNAR